MRVLCLSFFDPASVVLSHRNLMRAAGHDFRLAVVRAYTVKQRQADYVLEQLVLGEGSSARGFGFAARGDTDLGELREFAKSADVIQFHPGIGHGDNDWASSEARTVSPDLEIFDVLNRFGLPHNLLTSRSVWFMHGSRATWSHLNYYRTQKALGIRATSTIDYAYELDAAYLPPLVDVGDLRAKPRRDDDPLLIAHTPTDRVACSTEEFLKAAQGLGIPVRLGEGLKHEDCLRLKAECNAGFDHLRGAFSVNSLENAALGLVTLFGLNETYSRWALEVGNFSPRPIIHTHRAETAKGLGEILRFLSDRPDATRANQERARRWWETYFSAEPITKRLVRFYESL